MVRRKGDVMISEEKIEDDLKWKKELYKLEKNLA